MVSNSTTPPPSIRLGLLQAVPWSQNATWMQLSGGRTNQSWQVNAPGNMGTLVVKLFAPGSGNRLFPNDPACEMRALSALSAQSWAPNLLARFDTALGPCVAYAHIDGSCWSSDAWSVGVLMRQLHRTIIPDGLRVLNSDTETLLAQSRDFMRQANLDPRQLPDLPTGRQNHTIPAVFLHGDIVAGNLIQSAAGLSLIDWQCPAIGDPCHDIAIFLSPAMMLLYRGAVLTQSDVAGFFAGYGAPEIQARYHRLAPWFHHRMVAYCLWKAKQGSVDYGPAAAVEIAALHNCLPIPTTL